MKTLFISIALVVAAIAIGSCSNHKSNTRDFQYEAYCDSIWEANPTYYLDVLEESDEYQQYIEANGEWWEE